MVFDLSRFAAGNAHLATTAVSVATAVIQRKTAAQPRLEDGISAVDKKFVPAGQNLYLRRHNAKKNLARMCIVHLAIEVTESINFIARPMQNSEPTFCLILPAAGQMLQLLNSPGQFLGKTKVSAALAPIVQISISIFLSETRPR